LFVGTASAIPAGPSRTAATTASMNKFTRVFIEAPP
jgi:hypothetical protein